MRLRLVVPEKSFTTLMEKLSGWNANITSKDESGNEPSIVSNVIRNYISIGLIVRFLCTHTTNSL